MAIKERSLEETPTWAVAVVCFVILFISILIEYFLHFIGHVRIFLLLFSVFILSKSSFFFLFFSSPDYKKIYNNLIIEGLQSLLHNSFILENQNLVGRCSYNLNLFFYHCSGLRRSIRKLCVKLLKRLKQASLVILL